MRIVIPVEILTRELDGRTWLALNLLEKGHEVIIGKTPSIDQSMDVIDPDIIFTSSDHFRKYLSDTTGTVYLDMEGGIFSSKEAYQNRITPEPANSVETFFAWGEVPGEIAERSGCKNVVVSGNPRFDLLHDNLATIYDPKARKLQIKHGDFILLNTNFTRGNHENSPPLNVSTINDHISDKDDWNKFLCSEFITIAKRISTLDVSSVILRPHPSENHNTYKHAFSDNDSIQVIHRGDVRNWIRASKAVIHNSCTTGIEAAVMGTPTFAYLPMENPYGSHLPNSVSNKTSTKPELLTQIKSIVENGLDGDYQLNNMQKKELKKYIHNIDCLSAPLISESISNMEPRTSTEFNPDVKERIRRILRVGLGDKNMMRLRKTGVRDSWTYLNQKFPYLSTEQFQAHVDKFDPFIDISTSEIDITRLRRFENTFYMTTDR